MSWTDERVATLKKLWLDGYSASQVAKALGDTTRNGVIAKVHRLGIGKRGKPSQPKHRAPALAPVDTPIKLSIAVRQGPSSETKAGPYEQRVQRESINAALRAAPDPPPRNELKPTAGLLELGAHMCRWPIGNPASDGFGFCGRRQARGSYCEAHAKRAHGSTPSGLQDRNLTRGVL